MDARAAVAVVLGGALLAGAAAGLVAAGCLIGWVPRIALQADQVRALEHPRYQVAAGDGVVAVVDKYTSQTFILSPEMKGEWVDAGAARRAQREGRGAKLPHAEE